MTKPKHLTKRKGPPIFRFSPARPGLWMVWAGEPQQLLGAVERVKGTVSPRYTATLFGATEFYSHCFWEQERGKKKPRIFRTREAAGIAMIMQLNRMRYGRKRLDNGQIKAYRTPR